MPAYPLLDKGKVISLVVYKLSLTVLRISYGEEGRIKSEEPGSECR